MVQYLEQARTFLLQLPHSMLKITPKFTYKGTLLVIQLDSQKAIDQLTEVRAIGRIPGGLLPGGAEMV